MFKIDSNQTMRMSVGDDAQFPLFVNVGTLESPVRYVFQEDHGDTIYLMVYEINGEEAIIEKQFSDNGDILTFINGERESLITADDLINDNGDMVLRFAHTDTANLDSGEYRYEIRGKLVDSEASTAETTAYKYVTITNRLPLLLIEDDYSSRSWGGTTTTSYTYVYGRLNEIVKAANYTGVDTLTNDITINSNTGTIQVDNIINVSDTPVTNQFVTRVTQNNGAIAVERSTIPYTAVPDLPKEKIQGLDELLAGYQPLLTFTDPYSASTNPAATKAHVQSKIDALDSQTYPVSANETVKQIKETDGIVEVQKQNIELPISQVTGLQGTLTAIQTQESTDVADLDNRLDTVEGAISELDYNKTFSGTEVLASITQTNGQLATTTRNLQRSDFASNFFSEAQVQGLTTDLTSLQTSVTNEATARINADADLQEQIDAIETDVTQSLPAERTARIAADNALGTRIDNEIVARSAADSTLQSAITNEITNRTQADTNLSNTLNASITAETTARTNAISQLTADLTAEGQARRSGDTAEANARQTADATLQSNIDAEASARATAIAGQKSYTDSAVAAEATLREYTDTQLQNQIDALESKSDVVDIVGTYAELQAYPASHPKLKTNDIVKVLTDETHNNATSYYRWPGQAPWTYLGSLGPFYTKSEVDALVTTINASITTEATTRQTADTTLQSNIDDEEEAREAADTALETSISTQDTTLRGLITAEATAREAADTAITDSIGNATITIQKNGTTVDSFTVNTKNDKTINLEVTSDISSAITTHNTDTTAHANQFANYTKTEDLANVATSGSYADLSNKPTIGTGTLKFMKDGAVISQFNANSTTDLQVDISTDALPKATTTSLGAIIVGDNLTVDANGKVDATDTTYSEATITTAGLMSASDKTKLVGIEEGAQVNRSPDWNATEGSTSILNKPLLLTSFTDDLSLNGRTPTHVHTQYAQASDLALVATTGSYEDLDNRPTIGNGTLTIQKNGDNVGQFTANSTTDQTINITIDKASVMSALSSLTVTEQTLMRNYIDAQQSIDNGDVISY